MFANDESSDVERDFAAACDNPADFDFGFEAQRRDNSYANFGFDPALAAEMRQAEQDRDEFDDEDWDDEDEDYDWEDDEDEDEDIDRYADSYGFDDDDEDIDNWE